MRVWKRVLAAVGSVAITALVVIPLTAQEAARPKVMSHEAEGRDQCMMCHSGAMESIPAAPAATHEGRPNEVCQWCHGKDAVMLTKAPKVITHALEGRDNCLMCHKAGAMEAVPDAPADHEGREVKYCLMCHTTASG